MNNDFAVLLERLRGFLFWLPRWAAAAIVIALACAAALALHALALHFLRRTRAGKGAFIELLIMRAANPTRFDKASTAGRGAGSRRTASQRQLRDACPTASVRSGRAGGKADAA